MKVKWTGSFASVLLVFALFAGTAAADSDTQLLRQDETINGSVIANGSFDEGLVIGWCDWECHGTYLAAPTELAPHYEWLDLAYG